MSKKFHSFFIYLIVAFIFYSTTFSVDAASTVSNAVQEVAPMSYCVIDLSAGSTALHYPVSYLIEIPESGFTTDVYRTTQLVLRRIPAGRFNMQGVYNVTLTKDFYMGIFEVTQKQYERVTGEEPSRYKGDDLPVEMVSYGMIRGTNKGLKVPNSFEVDETSFLGKLRARTGLLFDLPSEAQWEYACRAGTETLYYWGDDKRNSDLYAWRQGGGIKWDIFQIICKTHTVGSLKPNNWGLYDMNGNVWEWCLDRFGQVTAGEDPKGPDTGLPPRVLRGGSWKEHNFSTMMRSLNFPMHGNYYNGFRLMLPCP